MSISDAIAQGISTSGLGKTASKIINQIQHGDPNYEPSSGSIAADLGIAIGTESVPIISAIRGVAKGINNINMLKKGIEAGHDIKGSDRRPLAPGLDYKEADVGNITVDIYTIVSPDGGIMVVTEPDKASFEKGNREGEGGPYKHLHEEYNKKVNESIARAQAEVQKELEHSGEEGLEKRMDGFIDRLQKVPAGGEQLSQTMTRTQDYSGPALG